MTNGSAKSTLFFSDRLRARKQPKDEQEKAAGVVFAKYYAESTGSLVKNVRRPPDDPPDLLFDWRDIVVGVEFFEVPAFYEERSVLDELVNLTYSEFASRGLEDRYLGVAIGLGTVISSGLLERMKQQWGTAGIRRNPLGQAAKELVNLVEANIAARVVLPKDDFGTMLNVNSAESPALAALTSRVVCRRCSDTTPRRSDGRASPLVLAGGAYDFNDEEMIVLAEKELRKKIGKRSGWHAVDRRIVLAHDYPRQHMSEGFSFEWPEWLALAAGRSHLLDYFDELWLLTAPTQYGQAYRIAPEPVLSFQ